MGTTRDMAGALNFRSGLLPIDDISYDEKMAMDPLTAKGNEIRSNMEKEYGEKKGKSVFYASKNAGKISGVDGGPGSGPQKGGGFRSTRGKLESEMSEKERKAHTEKLSSMSPEEMKQHLFERHGKEVETSGKNLKQLNKERYGKDGGPGSGPHPGEGKRQSLAERHPGKFTESRSKAIEANKRRNSERATLNSGGLPSGWSMRGGKRIPPAKDCAAEEMMTRDAMTNEEMEKWEKEKEDAHNMAPKNAANIGKGRFGGRGSEKAGSRDFTRKDEYNKAGT